MASKEKTKYPGVYSYDLKNGDVMYYIRYRKGGRGSSQVTEPVGSKSSGMTPRKASLVRSEKIDNAGNGESEEQTKEYTLDELAECYLGSIANVLSRKTQGGVYKKHMSPTLGKKKLDQITPMDVNKIIDKLVSEGKLCTARSVGLCLKTIINYSARMGLATRSKPIFFNKVKYENKKTEMLTDDELRRYIEAINNARWEGMREYMLLIMHTGIRKMAAARLRWTDFDKEKGILTLRGETAKNGKSNFIPVSKYVIELLSEWYKVAGDKYDGFMFQQIYHTYYTRRASILRDMAGLPSTFRPIHGLRHNFATRLASSGKVQLYTLQKLLTHSSPSMTQRYAHLTNEAMAAAANVADEVMSVSDNT